MFARSTPSGSRSMTLKPELYTNKLSMLDVVRNFSFSIQIPGSSKMKIIRLGIDAQAIVGSRYIAPFLPCWSNATSETPPNERGRIVLVGDSGQGASCALEVFSTLEPLSLDCGYIVFGCLR